MKKITLTLSFIFSLFLLTGISSSRANHPTPAEIQRASELLREALELISPTPAQLVASCASQPRFYQRVADFCKAEYLVVDGLDNAVRKAGGVVGSPVDSAAMTDFKQALNCAEDRLQRRCVQQLGRKCQVEFSAVNNSAATRDSKGNPVVVFGCEVTATGY